MIMHVDEAVGLSRLTRTLELAQERARREGRAVLASLTWSCHSLDPLAFFAASATYEDRVLWLQPARQFALVGAGATRVIEADAVERFELARQARVELLNGAIVDGADGAPRGTGPLLLGGFSFDPQRIGSGQWCGFPSARLILPRFLLTVSGEEHYLTLNATVRPDGDPATEARAMSGDLDALLARTRLVVPGRDHEGDIAVVEARPAAEWKQVVADASASIRRREAEKIVLAREVHLESEAPFEISVVLDRLMTTYPTCYVFAFAQGDRTFVGATPERLVQLEQGELKAACLAGSERRGATAEEDRALGEALLASRKDREEHAIVVRALRDGLAVLCDQLIAPDEPELLSVSNVHHLYTPIAGRLRAGVCILDAVERLHPTPAVGGFPRETALQFIREHEGMDRGWYAAPIGWVGQDGGGEFAVALRSALVDGSTASLFAGCGVMGDSIPEREYAESWLKFRPMLSALGGETR